MEKIKKYIIILIISLICIIIGIIIYLKNISVSSEATKELKEQENAYINTLNNPATMVNGKKPELVTYGNIYYTVSSLIKNYMKYIDQGNIQAVYNILDEEYIKENNINIEDVLFKIDRYSNIEKYKVEDMYELSGSRYTIYYVKGNLNNKKVFITVNTDFTNKTFSINPIKQEEYEKLINTIVEGMTGSEKQIDLNEYNKINYKNISTEQMSENLLQDYVINALYYPEKAYNSLDEDYREKRFGSLGEFKKYVEDNQKTLKKIDKSNIKSYLEFDKEEDYTNYLEGLDRIQLNKYATQDTENGTQFICVDDCDNYYIFDTTAVMKYTLKLDTYTIESDKFKTAYDSGSDQKKVQLNIDKFIKMINNKDYNHAYEVLDDQFKNNYFKTEDDFEKYVKNNFFEYNSVSYDKFSQEGEIYIYKITLSDKTLVKDNKKSINIIMQLKEGTDFVMSFGKAN